MSKAKYAILNGDNVLGLLWENEKLGNVLVTNGQLNISDGLEVYDCDTANRVNAVDLIDFILECMPTQ